MKLRQLVDWRAAVIAGLAASVVFLVANVALAAWVLESPWFPLRLVASLALGPDALPPPPDFDAGILGAALAVHLPLSVGFGCLVAYVVHRGGFVEGLAGGALLGLAFYAINFYTLTYFFPWVYPLKSWMMAVSHVLYGAAAGGLYEALEVRRYEKVAG